MAEQVVAEVFKATLETVWDGILYGENMQGEFSPPKLDDDGNRVPFIVLQFPYNGSRQASIGSPGDNWYRETGAGRVVYMIPRGNGATEARAKLEAIARAFRGKDLGSGVRTWAPTSAVFDDRNDVGGYFKFSISIPYTADIRG